MDNKNTKLTAAELYRKFSDIVSEGYEFDNLKNFSGQKDLTEIKEIHIPAIKTALNIVDNCIGSNKLTVQTDRLLNNLQKIERHLKVIKIKAGIKDE